MRQLRDYVLLMADVTDSVRKTVVVQSPATQPFWGLAQRLVVAAHQRVGYIRGLTLKPVGLDPASKQSALQIDLYHKPETAYQAIQAGLISPCEVKLRSVPTEIQDRPDLSAGTSAEDYPTRYGLMLQRESPKKGPPV